MKPDRYRNCFIGKDGVSEKHQLLFNEYTGRYACKVFVTQGMAPEQLSFTADEIDKAYFVYDKDGKLLN